MSLTFNGDELVPTSVTFNGAKFVPSPLLDAAHRVFAEALDVLEATPCSCTTMIGESGLAARGGTCERCRFLRRHGRLAF